MNAEQVIDLVNRIERELPVSAWRIDDVQLWPLIRGCLAFVEFDESTGAGWHRGGRLRRIGRRLRAFARVLGPVAADLARGDAPTLAARAVIVTDGVATARIDGVLDDVVGDPLRELLAEAGLSTATWYVTHACPQPRRTRGSLVQWRLDLAQALAVPFRLARARRTALPRYDDFLRIVRDAGLPPESVSLDRMALLAARVAAMSRRAAAWLGAASPAIVFVNCYYSLEGAAIVLACRRLGIASVDVQHGFQGDRHVAYGRWTDVPSGGYDLLPDRFWCWSQAEADAIDAWRTGHTRRHAPFVGGNPWLAMWRDDELPVVAAADRALDAWLPAEASLTVLVTLQWGMADDAFLEPVLGLVAAADPAWTWILRLHPAMRERYADIARRLAARGLARVRLDDSTRFALPTQLRRTDVHLTHSSSATLEAASLGVPTAVAVPESVGCFPELARSGRVVHVDCAAVAPALAALEALATSGRAQALAQAPDSLAVLKEVLSETGLSTRGDAP